MTIALLLLLAVWIPPVTLKSKTVKEFQAYMQFADRSMTSRATSQTRLALPANGEALITTANPENPRELTDGLVHDWIAATFIPNAKVPDVIAVLQDYPHYREIYQPDVLQTRLINQSGATRKIRMRTIKKKISIITVVLDIDLDVEFRTLPNGRAQVWSRSTSVREVEHAGEKGEKIGKADHGAGFLWNLNTYWHLEERDGGVYLEFRAISLTRDIPAFAEWAVKPMVTALPRESLANTLTATRAAVETRLRRRGA